MISYHLSSHLASILSACAPSMPSLQVVTIQASYIENSILFAEHDCLNSQKAIMGRAIREWASRTREIFDLFRSWGHIEVVNEDSLESVRVGYALRGEAERTFSVRILRHKAQKQSRA